MSPATSDDQSEEMYPEKESFPLERPVARFPHQAIVHSDRVITLEEEAKLEKLDYLALFIAMLQTVFLPLLIIMGIILALGILFAFLG